MNIDDNSHFIFVQCITVTDNTLISYNVVATLPNMSCGSWVLVSRSTLLYLLSANLYDTLTIIRVLLFNQVPLRNLDAIKYLLKYRSTKQLNETRF